MTNSSTSRLGDCRSFDKLSFNAFFHLSPLSGVSATNGKLEKIFYPRSAFRHVWALTVVNDGH